MVCGSTPAKPNDFRKGRNANYSSNVRLMDHKQRKTITSKCNCYTLPVARGSVALRVPRCLRAVNEPTMGFNGVDWGQRWVNAGRVESLLCSMYACQHRAQLSIKVIHW
jgi:hypothetical protein